MVITNTYKNNTENEKTEKQSELHRKCIMLINSLHSGEKS